MYMHKADIHLLNNILFHPIQTHSPLLFLVPNALILQTPVCTLSFTH